MSILPNSANTLTVSTLSADAGIVVGKAKLTEKNIIDFLEVVEFFGMFAQQNAQAKEILTALRAKKRILK